MCKAILIDMMLNSYFSLGNYFSIISIFTLAIDRFIQLNFYILRFIEIFFYFAGRSMFRRTIKQQNIIGFLFIVICILYHTACHKRINRKGKRPIKGDYILYHWGLTNQPIVVVFQSGFLDNIYLFSLFHCTLCMFTN